MTKNKKSKPLGVHIVFHRMLKAGNCSSLQAVLLCKRTQDAPIHPSLWALLGGKVESAETTRQVLHRELDEELKAKNIFLKIFVR